MTGRFFLFFSAVLLLATADGFAQPAALTDSQGYLLMELDVGGVAPAISIGKLGKRGTIGKPVRLDLKKIEERFYLIPLESGRYQVTEINAPLYNLPFRIDTSSEGHWQFSVASGRINYFGKLLIESKRSKDSVKFERLNHLASTLADINQQFSSQLTQYPLIESMGYRDDFYRVLNAEDEVPAQ